METSETISLSDIVGNRDVFALQVRGDSMRDEHIVDGDYVFVEKVSVAHEGDIVVALVRGAETTLKRYYLEGALFGCSHRTRRWIRFLCRPLRSPFRGGSWA